MICVSLGTSMSISTYSELQTAVANWLNRDTLTSRIPEFITLAEARIARKLRVTGMEARDTSITTVAGTEYYTLPSDYLEMRNIQLNTNPRQRLKYRTPEQLDTEYPTTTTGVPTIYTIIGTELQLRPIPAAANTLEIAYYKKLAALSSSNTTNWFTANAPDLLLYGALIEAEPFLYNDARIAIWKGLFDQSIAEWNLQADRARHSGSALVIRQEVSEND